MRKSYTYPAIFEYAPDGINISFPDLPGCLSCAENNSEAIYMAEDALELRLKSDLKSGALISEPTDILELQNSLHDNQVVTLIRVDLQLQDERDTKAINKFLGLTQKDSVIASRNLEKLSNGQAVSNIKEYPRTSVFEVVQYYKEK